MDAKIDKDESLSEYEKWRRDIHWTNDDEANFQKVFETPREPHARDKNGRGSLQRTTR